MLHRFENLSGKWFFPVSCLVFLIIGASEGGGIAVADDWPQWLGPQRDAVWRERGIMERFPAEGLQVRWRTSIGSGYAGPAVAAGKVFVMDRQLTDQDPVRIAKLKRDFGPAPNYNYTREISLGKERLLCLDEPSGRILWTHAYDCPYTTAKLYATGPRVTPIVDGERVYSLGAEGNLFCLSREDGKVLWHVDFKTQYGIEIPHWGIAAQPLIDGHKLICTVGGKGTTAVAFDKKSGKELWRALSSKRPGYAPVMIYRAGGKRQLIIWHGESVNSLNPETGQVYWTIPVATHWGMAISTPRLYKNYLFVSGFNRQSTMIALDTKEPKAKVVWRGNNQIGISSTMSTPVLQDDVIYGGGFAGRYRCVQIRDGKRLWMDFRPTTGKRPRWWANVFTIKQGDRFFLANDQGELMIAKLDQVGYHEISRTKLLEPTTSLGQTKIVWSHPAFANRSVYARNDREIVCLSLAKSDAP